MNKLNLLRQALVEQKLDALIITNPFNRRYMTGFTGTAGVAIVSEKAAIFITDFRYTSQATTQVKDFTIVEHKQGLEQEVSNQLKEIHAKRIGFEKHDMSFATYEQYQDVIDGQLIPTSELVERLRMIKSDEELLVMKKAAEIADAAFEHIQGFIKPGVREIEVSNELEFYMRKLGATSSSFDTIVASGFRSALPHGVASEKEIQNGELVTLDYGALYNGYCSDITRTVAVGEISEELRTIYNTVLEAQLIGVNGIKPGMTGKEADALTRDYITKAGYGQYFGHSTGHGLGMEVHEAPGLSYRSDVKLEVGMVVTVEPGIYIPRVGGCRIEDDIVITKDGNERLTTSSKELIIL
ncbi:Xaa-Pro peptidase family protein [Virgibacillus soli]|uniref:Xaa-Pro peptidase family protein n=1 Tax=Paracerasibacillus soli TaxID=480284 RepID=A0ABU5CPW4_9BACI|nr:Xaa-Pro peptidase family protein [Virgibacillus soli]MDY0408412.1 Xaa-Pro peptidase family protein [Virgibacillus soli]